MQNKILKMKLECESEIIHVEKTSKCSFVNSVTIEDRNLRDSDDCE